MTFDFFQSVAPGFTWSAATITNSKSFSQGIGNGDSGIENFLHLEIIVTFLSVRLEAIFYGFKRAIGEGTANIYLRTTGRKINRGFGITPMSLATTR